MTSKLDARALGLLAGAIALLAAGSASAHSTKYDPDKRAAALAAEIEQGRRDGSITFSEGARLRAEQRRIEQVEAGYKASGRGLDARELRDLKRLQDQSASHIDQSEENALRRWWLLPRVGR